MSKIRSDMQKTKQIMCLNLILLRTTSIHEIYLFSEMGCIFESCSYSGLLSKSDLLPVLASAFWYFY